MVVFALYNQCLLWWKAWNCWHQGPGITGLFQWCLVVLSLIFFSPDFFFCCQLHCRVPVAVFRLQPHVNHNFSSYHQFFHFIPCPLLLPSVSDTAARGPRRRQGAAGEMCLYLSQLKLRIFPIQLWVIIPPAKPTGMEPWVVISAINFSVSWCLPLLSPVTGFSSEPTALGWGNETPARYSTRRVTN